MSLRSHRPLLVALAALATLAACELPTDSFHGPDGGGGADATQGAPARDAGPSAPWCFDAGIVRGCVSPGPARDLILPTTTLDTVTSPSCSASIQDYCVIAGTSIEIEGVLRATGARPLVLAATTSIAVHALIDVGSHRDSGPGAGADPAECTTGASPTTAAGTSGGGAGGTFTRRGGHGGDGAAAMNSGGLAVDPVLPASVTQLRGGCPGQPGAGASQPPGGHGGGAVFLYAGNTIDLEATIDAGGQGGSGAPKLSQGGGGGGSGGMIAFRAPTIITGAKALVFATGGGGGEASTHTNIGNAGADASSAAAAAGGSGGTTNGGHGGAGSTGSPTAGVNDGTDGSGTTDLGGGGGGGGGAGLIKGPAALASQAAPAPVP